MKFWLLSGGTGDILFDPFLVLEQYFGLAPLIILGKVAILADPLRVVEPVRVGTFPGELSAPLMVVAAPAHPLGIVFALGVRASYISGALHHTF